MPRAPHRQSVATAGTDHHNWHNWLKCFGPKHLTFWRLFVGAGAGLLGCVIRRGNYVNPARMQSLRQRMAAQARAPRRTNPFSTEVSLDALLAGSQRTDSRSQWIKAHLRVVGRMDSPTGSGGAGSQWGWQAFRVDASELQMLIRKYQRENPQAAGTTSYGVSEFLMNYYTDMDIQEVDQIYVGSTGER